MASVRLERRGAVFVLTMADMLCIPQAGENRFNPTFVRALNAALDTVEASEGAAALVTVGEGKFFSNGLDLDWVISEGSEGMVFVERDFLGLLRRLITFPVPTVAALNGHAFAGGCLLALAHDYRFMRTERGYICMNEIELPAPLTPGMAAVLRAKMAPHTLRECLLQAKRFGTEDALAHRLIDGAVPEARLLEVAIAHAEKCSEKGSPAQRRTMHLLKFEMYRDVVDRISVESRESKL